jgi:biotin carboxylase
VDKRYYTPSPAEDWRAGKIHKENSWREEAYIRAVKRICEREQIDTIFPSFDPHVYVFSKNKERFKKMGVLIPIPDYETVITPLDKYRTILAAQEVGFPCPRTYLPESEDDLRRIAEELGFPLVVKPRLTAGGRGTEIAKDFAELSEKAQRVRKNQGIPMIQEYIPGNRQQQVSLVLDKRGDLKVAFCKKRHRQFLRLRLSFPTAEEPIVLHHYVTHAAKLLHKLNWWGGAGVQTKVDSRDGIAKLMEINPRLGYRLWIRTELGINEPLMCLKIACGEEVEALKDYPLGKMLLDPIEDMLGLGFKLLDLFIYKFRIGVLGKVPIDPSNPPMSLMEIMQSYRETYLNGKEKVFNPYFKYFLQDPLVSVLWWFQFCGSVSRAAKQLGK